MYPDKKDPSVSVVIPVKNEVSKIRACLEGILSQTIPVKEIIVIDSGSTDGTQSIVREFDKAMLIEIDPATFNHGGTRNLGVNLATGEFVLMTVGDARPCNDKWIENMLAGFTDEEVAGVCGLQVVPHDRDKNPVEWFRPQSAPSIKRYAFTPEELEKLPPEKMKEICGWDDVSAMYRRKEILALPFRITTYGEDAIWAKEALMSGKAIVYNSAARVFHYHQENDEFTFKRTLTTSYFRYKQFNYIPPLLQQGLIANLRLVKSIWTANPFGFRANWKWLQYNLAQRRSLKKAIIVFSDALKKGEQELDIVHTKYCGKPPIPQKQTN